MRGWSPHTELLYVHLTCMIGNNYLISVAIFEGVPLIPFTEVIWRSMSIDITSLFKQWQTFNLDLIGC